MAEPAAKKQKTEEGAAEAEEKKEEPEEEVEKDAVALKGAKLKDKITFLTQDTTLNVVLSSNSSLLLPLSDGGVRHLLAGARSNVGLKAGRYMFEAKIVEQVSRAEESNKPHPKFVFRVGFSTAASSPLMGNDETSVCFDMEGFMMHNKEKTSLGMGARCGKGSIVAVVLNLEKGSPNHNTISLFRDGKRVTKPQALPSALQGKPLYPTVTYRNLAVALCFGPQPQAPLPFTCHMPQNATTAQASLQEAEKETEYEVLFPICLPDQGGFDWLDSFKKKNPKYTEISDRMLLDWAEKSGIYAPKGVGSNDKPDLRFGIPEMDDMSIRRMIQSVAPLQKRNYIVMEVRGNLIKETRADALSTYFDSCYKKVAKVVVGEASKDFVKMSQELLLAEKQEQSDKEFKMKKEEAARKKAAEKKMKEIEKAKKKAEKERQKKLEEMKKAAEKAKKEAERKKAEAEGKEVPEEEEEEKDVEMDEEEEEEEEEAEEVDEEPPKVELTPEEKKMKFRKTALPDVASSLLNRCFTKFTVPDLEEGFDDIAYEWSQGGKAVDYVSKWIKEKKLTSRVEDLTPSTWFKTKAAAWQKVLSHWQAKVPEYKSKLVKKAQAKQAKENKKKMAEAKAAAEKAKKEAEKAEAKEEEKDEEVKEEEEKAEAMEVDEEEEEEEEEADFEGVDIFGVEEVDDIGGGTPLYKEFAHEDWALMSLSFELHLMAHAFKKDCDDPDRKGIVLEHLAFYYQKYYGKQLNLKSYGIENEAQLVDLAKDCVFINKDKVLESLLDEEIEYPQVFVKIAEEGRRHRALLVDMGDESAKLKITHAVSSHHKGGKDSGKGMGMKGHSKGYGKGIMPVGPIGMGPMQQGMGGAPMGMAPMGNMGKGKDFGKGYGHMPFGKGGKGWKGK